MIWAYLIHLGYNMWLDREAPELESPDISAKPYLRFDETLWTDLVEHLAKSGVNLLVIDLGEGVNYSSHPEIAVKGSWEPGKLKQEIKRLRSLGIEPIPKLNFSATHDTWLGQYARMVSTPTYYAVCRDLIAEVSELFDGPRFFHLGMDEETAEHQQHHSYAVIRQHDLWWNDLLFLVKEAESHGAQAWIWSDYAWNNPESFYRLMPRSVIQSNWYYGAEFDLQKTPVRTYIELDKHGFKQIPTGSNWLCDTNFDSTVGFAKQNISQDNLLGFLQTVWHPTIERYRQKHFEATDQLAQARINHYK